MELRSGVVEGDRVLLYNPSLPDSNRKKDDDPKAGAAKKSDAGTPAEATAPRKSGS